MGLVYKGSLRAILGCFWLGHFRMLGKGAAAPRRSDRIVRSSTRWRQHGSQHPRM